MSSRASAIKGTGQELARSTERPRIVHVLTQLQTVFGVLDAEGNVAQRLPVTTEISILGPKQFAEAYNQIAAKKLELEAQLAAVKPE